jgi:hypothetical protein
VYSGQQAVSVAIGFQAGANTQGNIAVAIGYRSGNTLQGQGSVAIGQDTGGNVQGTNAVAIGPNAGANTQGQNSVAIGNGAAANTQAQNAVAIGIAAGSSGQGVQGVAIGYYAGLTTQGSSAVAIGQSAGQTTQGGSAVAIGVGAGGTNQVGGMVAIGAYAGAANAAGTSVGFYAGSDRQSTLAVAVGQEAGRFIQGAGSISMGFRTGRNSQGVNGVSIGQQAGENEQGNNSIAIGTSAGITRQSFNSVAIGPQAGQFAQRTGAVAIGASVGLGVQAAFTNTGTIVGNVLSIAGNTANVSGSFGVGQTLWGTNVPINTYIVALGTGTGNVGTYILNTNTGNITANTNVWSYVGQGNSAVAIGNVAARYNQGGNAVAIGYAAGDWNQGNLAIAIGSGTANRQGTGAIAIGANSVANNQVANSIVINASGNAIVASNVGLYINPVRNDLGNLANAVYYNISTRELTYGPSSLASTDYIHVVRTTNQSWNSSNLAVLFNSTVATNSSIPYNSSTGVFTLSANKTYRLTAGIPLDAAGGYNSYQWQYSGNTTPISTATGMAATTSYGASTIEVIFTSTTDTTVALKSLMSAGSTIYGGAWAVVQQFGASAVTNNLTITGGLFANTIGGTAANAGMAFSNYKDVVNSPAFVASYAPDVSTGSVFRMTLTNNITINGFGGTPQSGQSATLILTQDATGNRTLSSTMKFAGGNKTLSTAANAIDMLFIFYDGTTYYASLTKGYQ